MKLNNRQIQFLLKFFPDNCAGAKSIATTLITEGKCIVAGTDRIWLGGIGNFISIEPVKGAFKCTEHTFDLKAFLSSEFFKDAAQKELSESQRKLVEAEIIVTSIVELIKK